MKDYSSEKNRGYRYVVAVIDNFSKFGWTVPLKNKKSRTIKDSLENNPISSKRIPNLLETDRGKEFYNSIFHSFLRNNNIGYCSRKRSFVAVFSERFNRTIKDLLKRPIFEQGDSSLVDLLFTRIKEYSFRVQSSTKLTTIQASLKRMKNMFINIF